VLRPICCGCPTPTAKARGIRAVCDDLRIAAELLRNRRARLVSKKRERHILPSYPCWRGWLNAAKTGRGSGYRFERTLIRHGLRIAMQSIGVFLRTAPKAAYGHLSPGEKGKKNQAAAATVEPPASRVSSGSSSVFFSFGRV